MQAIWQCLQPIHRSGLTNTVFIRTYLIFGLDPNLHFGRCAKDLGVISPKGRFSPVLSTHWVGDFKSHVGPIRGKQEPHVAIKLLSLAPPLNDFN